MTFQQDIIVLVGLMGAGKTRVGSELAKQLKIPFVDADREIEVAAGLPISDIFDRFGEEYFRAGEKKVLIRLLSGGQKVLATGGGAFLQDDVRDAIKEKARSVWLRADLETLVDRTSRTNHRPLLQGEDASEKLKEMIEVRYPIYAEADITITTDRKSPYKMAREIIGRLEDWKNR